MSWKAKDRGKKSGSVEKNRRILQKGSQYQRLAPSGHIGCQKSAGGVAGDRRRTADDLPDKPEQIFAVACRL